MTKLITCTLWLVSAVSSFAIDTGRSSAEFTLGQNALEGTASFAWEDIDAVLEIDLDKDGVLDPDELEQSKFFLSEYGETLFHVQSGEQTLAPASVQLTWNVDLGAIEFHYDFSFDTPMHVEGMKLEFVGHRDFPVGHQQQLKLVDTQGDVLVVQRIGDPAARPLFPSPSPVAKLLNPKSEVALAGVSPSVHLPMTLFATGFLVIALTASAWFIRRTRLAQ